MLLCLVFSNYILQCSGTISDFYFVAAIQYLLCLYSCSIFNIFVWVLATFHFRILHILLYMSDAAAQVSCVILLCARCMMFDMSIVMTIGGK
jgi:hypothetical protein